MSTTHTTALLRPILATVPLGLALALAACGGGDGNGAMAPPVAAAPTPTPPPPPAPSPTPSPTSRDVSACLTQVIPGTGGATPASLVVPDTIKLSLANASGFPNGRDLDDQSPDILLAVLFLDMTKHSPATFASLPLNPAANDRPFLDSFPFVAAPQGTPPLAPGTGTSFNFRTDPLSAYVRVDREGQPAVTTAVIGGALKNAYNDDNPAEDVTGKWVPEIVNQLTLLHNGLADDLIALGLNVCSK
jgi:hypothetical protein